MSDSGVAAHRLQGRRRSFQPPSADDLELRPARATDSPGLVALVGACFREYPGCVLHVNEEEPGLLQPAAAFDACWILAWEDRVLGSIAAVDRPSSAAGDDAEQAAARSELKKCYLHPWVRGRGLSSRLVQLVENRAWSLGHAAVELWSDTRFTQAHAVYSHLGYRPTGQERALHDRSATREFHFVKPRPDAIC